jgi:hypothetical protein
MRLSVSQYIQLKTLSHALYTSKRYSYTAGIPQGLRTERALYAKNGFRHS